MLMKFKSGRKQEFKSLIQAPGKAVFLSEAKESVQIFFRKILERLGSAAALFTQWKFRCSAP
jgi:hypothetical protein